jgi:hypothetical protein
MPAANIHHHVWRLFIEPGVATSGTNSVLVREPKSYSQRTSAAGAGQVLRHAGRCDTFEVRQCSEFHTLDQLLELQEGTRPA